MIHSRLAKSFRTSLVLLALIPLLSLHAQEASIPGTEKTQTPSAEELAKKLAYPVAALISVPFQGNVDTNIGPADEGSRITLNLQPVGPISLNEQ